MSRGPAAIVNSRGALALDASPGPRTRHVHTLVVPVFLVLVAALALAAALSVTAPGSRRPTVSPSVKRGALLLPASLTTAASASLGASDPRYWTTRRRGSLVARGGGVESTFNASGADLRVAQGNVSVSLSGIGRGGSLRPLEAVAPSAVTDQAVYRYRPVSAFYRNGPYGLEQGFTVRRPQAGSGALVLAMRLGGSLRPERRGSRILFKAASGATALRYGDLEARDAGGRRLPAEMRLLNGTLELTLDTRAARYPLRIDPLFEGTKLTGEDEANEAQFGAQFGYSAAISADGSTAVIGGPADAAEQGAVWVFTRSGAGTWAQQGPKLKGSEEVSIYPHRVWFGSGVAISADGNTVLVGGPGDDGATGAVWAFTRSKGAWTQAGPKIQAGGETSEGNFGGKVALSADGNTALIGGSYDEGRTNTRGSGAVWVFTRSAETWTQQGEKITPSGEMGGGVFGDSLLAVRGRQHGVCRRHRRRRMGRGGMGVHPFG